jgi:hypothetical protein
MTEQQLALLFDSALDRLGQRCVWRREVPLLLWRPGELGMPARGRIDRVARIDAGPLLGFELKATPHQSAAIGEYFAQSATYAAGQVAPAAPGKLPVAWTGRPLHAVFLAFDTEPLRYPPYQHVGRHAVAAESLFGPAKVGFVDSRVLQLGELRLRLCRHGFWSAHYGYNKNTSRQRYRIGSGTAAPTEVGTTPEERAAFRAEIWAAPT